MKGSDERFCHQRGLFCTSPRNVPGLLRRHQEHAQIPSEMVLNQLEVRQRVARPETATTPVSRFISRHSDHAFDRTNNLKRLLFDVSAPADICAYRNVIEIEIQPPASCCSGA